MASPAFQAAGAVLATKDSALLKAQDVDGDVGGYSIHTTCYISIPTPIPLLGLPYLRFHREYYVYSGIST